MTARDQIEDHLVLGGIGLRFSGVNMVRRRREDTNVGFRCSGASQPSHYPGRRLEFGNGAHNDRIRKHVLTDCGAHLVAHSAAAAAQISEEGVELPTLNRKLLLQLPHALRVRGSLPQFLQNPMGPSHT